MSNRYRLVKEYPGSLKLNTTVYLETEDNYMTNMENDFRLFPKKIVENYPEFWQPIVEKDYEILSFKSNEGNIVDLSYFTCEEDFIGNSIWKINSVKRNDGEIFTIGDKTEFGLISKIVINNNSLSFYFEQKSCGYNLQTLIKWKPLFKTEDGVDIFENNTSIYVLDKFTIRHIKHKDFNVISKHVKYFSSKEKAEEYILMNKPCLSINEITNLTETNPPDWLNKELIKIVKSKIQQSV